MQNHWIRVYSTILLLTLRLRHDYCPRHCDITEVHFCVHLFISLGITLLELASDLDLPRGGDTWHQLRNGQLPDVFTQGLQINLIFTNLILR